jgi:hypothetical protein
MALDNKVAGEKLYAFEINNLHKAIRNLQQNILDLNARSLFDVSTNGNGTRNTGVTSTTITHNLGKIPKTILFYAVKTGFSSTGMTIMSQGSYVDGVEKCVAVYKDGNPGYESGVGNKLAYISDYTNGSISSGTAVTITSIDETNFVLGFTYSSQDTALKYTWIAF